MAYDLETLRTKVRNRIDDTSYESTVIDQFVNYAQRQVLNTYVFPFMERTFVGTLVADANTFLLPTTAQTVVSFRITAPDDSAGFLEYLPFREFDKRFPDPSSATAGKPQFWTFVNNTFKVHPKADQVYELELRYVKKPDELVDGTDVPEIPEAFSEIIVLGTHQRILERDDSYNEAQVVEQKFDQLLEDMVQRLVTRQIGKPHIMATGRMEAKGRSW